MSARILDAAKHHILLHFAIRNSDFLQKPSYFLLFLLVSMLYSYFNRSTECLPLTTVLLHLKRHDFQIKTQDEFFHSKCVSYNRQALFWATNTFSTKLFSRFSFKIVPWLSPLRVKLIKFSQLFTLLLFQNIILLCLYICCRLLLNVCDVCISELFDQ